MPCELLNAFKLYYREQYSNYECELSKVANWVATA
jgi:hypothetical protein